MRRSDSKEQTAKGSSEAALIRRAAQGDAEAFNRLVMRHRQSVLHFAWTMVRDWDLAEDLAQQTLLEAYRGLSGLREPPKFRAWLLTIARRRAMRHWGSLASQPPTIEFSESVIYPLAHEPSLLASDEVSDRIRESLLELSSRNRQVMVLHYLDGYSCDEISSRLSIPAGTVKRILHESRNHLRTGMGIAAPAHPGGGTRTMSTKRKPGPRYLIWWINGQWPGNILGDLLSRAACLAANKKPKTIAQLSRELDANAAYIEQSLQPAINEGLMSKTEDGTYLTSFIAMDAEDWIAVTAGVREHSIRVADFMKQHLPMLEDAWNRTALPSRGFPWEQQVWPVLTLLVANQGVSRQRGPGPEAPLHASGKRYWPGAHEIVGRQHHLWGVGFNIVSREDAPIGYGNLWSYGLERKYPSGGGPDQVYMVIMALYKGKSEVEQVAQDSGLRLEQVREIVADMIEQGVAAQDDGRLSLLFPIFGKAESDILTPVIDEVAKPLVSDLLTPATADLADRLQAAGYGPLEEQFSAWQGWLMGNICGEAVRELLDRGVLPAPGDPAPANFALIGWEKDLPLMT